MSKENPAYDIRTEDSGIFTVKSKLEGVEESKQDLANAMRLYLNSVPEDLARLYALRSVDGKIAVAEEKLKGKDYFKFRQGFYNGETDFLALKDNEDKVNEEMIQTALRDLKHNGTATFESYFLVHIIKPNYMDETGNYGTDMFKHFIGDTSWIDDLSEARIAVGGTWDFLKIGDTSASKESLEKILKKD